MFFYLIPFNLLQMLYWTLLNKFNNLNKSGIEEIIMTNILHNKKLMSIYVILID